MRFSLRLGGIGERLASSVPGSARTTRSQPTVPVSASEPCNTSGGRVDMFVALRLLPGALLPTGQVSTKAVGAQLSLNGGFPCYGHPMRGRQWASSIFMLGLGCLVLYAPSAVAKPKPSSSGLLPFRSCLGLLDIADFQGAVEETNHSAPYASSHPTWDTGSFCAYWNRNSAKKNLQGDSPSPENVGADSLTVWSRVIYSKHPDLFTWHRSAPFLFFKGHSLQGVGTHAVWTINNEGDKEAAVQVRNDIFTVSEFSGGVRQVLSKVAHELSPTGK